MHWLSGISFDILLGTGFAAGGAGGSADQSRLGVCTPFAAQRDVLERLTSETGVVVGTVHRYQGDEKQAMVIDVPDSLGERYVSLFAQAGSPEDAGAKLFNVAVSRAQEHIIFVANQTTLTLNYLLTLFFAGFFTKSLQRARLLISAMSWRCGRSLMTCSA